MSRIRSKQQAVSSTQRIKCLFLTTYSLLLATASLGKKCVQHVKLVGINLWTNTFYTQRLFTAHLFPQKLIKSYTVSSQLMNTRSTQSHPLYKRCISTDSTTPIITTICKGI